MTEKEAQLLAQAEAWVKEKLAADAMVMIFGM